MVLNYRTFVLLFFCIPTILFSRSSHRNPLQHLYQLSALKKGLGTQRLKRKPVVHVLLDEVKGVHNHTWHVSSSKGFKVIDARGTTQMLGRFLKDATVSTKRNGHFYVNHRRVGDQIVHLIPLSGTFSCKGKEYKGSCVFMRQKGTVYFINPIDLELYVSSVLRSESWPGWPLEYNKVQAIASRTYVIAMMLRAQELKQPYDVRPSNIHQTYNGTHDVVTIKKAVWQTRGMFLGYDGKPILAMFDSCCGGVIPAKIAEFDFSKAPYLARKKRCKYCKRCWIFNWKASFTPKELEKAFNKEFGDVRKFKKIKITQRDKAGVVQEVAVKRKRSKYNLSAHKTYSLLKGVKSFCFDIKKKKGVYHFSGVGYGHHIGLCQWGAREMVRDGWDYKKILAFYYPGTKFMKLV